LELKIRRQERELADGNFIELSGCGGLVPAVSWRLRHEWVFAGKKPRKQCKSGTPAIEPTEAGLVAKETPKKRPQVPEYGQATSLARPSSSLGSTGSLLVCAET
jgi:hypothetical protein